MNDSNESLHTAGHALERASRRARYKDLFERMLDPVFLLSRDHFEILDHNPAAETVFGAESPEGQTLAKWLDPEVYAELERMLRAARRSYHPRQLRVMCNVQASSEAASATSRYFDALIVSLALEGDSQSEIEPDSDPDQNSVIQVILRDVTREVRARQELEVLSSVDEMTQIPNYRRFKFELEKEHEKSVISNGGYSIVFCDVDHFKAYNDREGHPAGDALLRELAGIIKSQCRGSDFPARYGGEEFAVLCRGTRSEGAMIFAERLRTAVERHSFKGGDRQPLGKLSLSIGIADFPKHGKTPAEVLNAADQALYLSKKNGRNRVTLAGI